MKKLLISILMLVFIAGCQPYALSMNVLMENQKFKNELQNTAVNQSLENPQWIQYYKGKPNYAGASYGVSPSAVNYGAAPSAKMPSGGSSSKKDIYAKKGVKFKIKNEDKIKILKEKQQEEAAKDIEKKKQNVKAAKNTAYSSSASKKTMTRESSVKKSIESKQAQTKKQHNADAE